MIVVVSGDLTSHPSPWLQLTTRLPNGGFMSHLSTKASRSFDISLLCTAHDERSVDLRRMYVSVVNGCNVAV